MAPCRKVPWPNRSISMVSVRMDTDSCDTCGLFRKCSFRQVCLLLLLPGVCVAWHESESV